MAFWQDSNLLLIDGGLVPAGGGRTFPSIDPATEAVVGESADATAADAERAIRAARRAFDETDWSTDPKRRAGCLRHLAAAMRDVLEELRELTVREVGVPISMTSGPALEGPIGLLDFYADLAESYDGTVDLGPYEAYGGLHQRTVLREPYGVVSAISAYNYPTQLNLAKLGPALAAGCTVVLKGAPDTPLITLALGRLIAERTDIPPGVVNVLASSAVEPGVVMTTDTDVDMVTFDRLDRRRPVDHGGGEPDTQEDVPRAGRQVGTDGRGREADPHRDGQRERRHVARARRAVRRLQAVRDRPRERHGGARGVPADEAARPPGKGLSTTVPEPMTSTLDPGGAWSWS
jgi:hypothetical protein